MIAMNKSTLVDQILAELEARWNKLAAAARDAHAGATDSENKAENKYDTRGLESSYLAAGQAEQAEELALAIHTVQALAVRNFGAGEAVGLSALVTVEFPGETENYLMVPAGGGVEVVVEGMAITTLAPQSPMARALAGRRAGESIRLGPTAPEARIRSVR